MARSEHFLSPLLKKAVAPALTLRTTGGVVIATHLTPAFDSATRKQGLLGREHLDDAEAVIIAPCSAVHTFGMRFPIDVLYADRSGRVLKVRSAIPPKRVSGCWGAFAAIEVSATRLTALGITRGDVVVVVKANPD